MNKYKKINTFTQIPSPAQILAYLLFLLQVITFYVIIQTNLQSQISKIIMIVLYSLSIIIQLISSLICAIIDPSDTFMIKYLNSLHEATSAQLSQMLYCDICHSYVQQSSRHCKMCGRCVEGFDHHCIWINNCIGSLNYRYFIIMIVSTFISMLLYLTSVGVLWAENRWNTYLGQMITVWCTSVLVIIFVVLIVNLILFHIYLNCKNITTYDYIMISREKQRLNKLEQERRKEQIKTLNKTEQQLNQIKNQFPVEAKEEQIKKFLEQNRETKRKFAFKQSNEAIKNSKVTQFNRYQHSAENSDNQSKNSQVSSNKSQKIKMTQFFTKNRSLKILINTDAIHPEQYHSKVYPQTTKNQSEIKKQTNQFHNLKKVKPIKNMEEQKL